MTTQTGFPSELNAPQINNTPKKITMAEKI
jgi:hypothetical protein